MFVIIENIKKYQKCPALDFNYKAYARENYTSCQYAARLRAKEEKDLAVHHADVEGAAVVAGKVDKVEVPAEDLLGEGRVAQQVGHRLDLPSVQASHLRDKYTRSLKMLFVLG